MICPNCGSNNRDGSNFCIKCGTNLKDIESQQPLQQSMNNQQNIRVSDAPLNYLMYIVAILLKPLQCFKEEEAKLCNTKTALVFSSIIAGLMMLITLIKSVIAAIFTKNIDHSTFKYKTGVDFGRLKDLDWLSLIGKNLFIFAGVIAAIALGYYIVSLIFKKSANFIKLLSISATSLIPYIVFGMVASPLIGKIWAPLSLLAMIFGAVYSVLILVNLMNKDLIFDSVDTKIHFHLICLSVLGSAGYYLYIKLMVSGTSNNLNDLLNLFS